MRTFDDTKQFKTKNMKIYRVHDEAGISQAYATLDHALLVKNELKAVTYIEHLELTGVEDDLTYLTADNVTGEIHITTQLGDLVTIVDLELIRVDDMIEYSATIKGKCVDFLNLSTELVFDIHMLAENIAQNIEDNNLPLNLR